MRNAALNGGAPGMQQQPDIAAIIRERNRVMGGRGY
jgi:hypothetical protein